MLGASARGEIERAGILGAYRDICLRLTEGQFCERGPHPFLVHSRELGGPMVPTAGPLGATLDRLVLSATPSRSGEGHPLDSAFQVFALRPARPGARTLSLGCSSSCDVQVNDASISSLHAVLELQGGHYLLTDQDSAAGTLVNDDPLCPGLPRALHSGDRLTLGFVDLMFLLPGDFYHFVRRLLGDRPDA
ncbi:MAG TPA: FHA domain-containing protein [Myxococcota bacterium]|nr:FHA domain-containing protein [Myxococcota bacterium]HRY93812.1 FHA domain-containing protein [Myxococcota bacterium]HSA21613.1 FHA domain-containing protein [Myxococcota bacterium]